MQKCSFTRFISFGVVAQVVMHYEIIIKEILAMVGEDELSTQLFSGTNYELIELESEITRAIFRPFLKQSHEMQTVPIREYVAWVEEWKTKIARYIDRPEELFTFATLCETKTKQTRDYLKVIGNVLTKYKVTYSPDQKDLPIHTTNRVGEGFFRHLQCALDSQPRIRYLHICRIFRCVVAWAKIRCRTSHYPALRNDKYACQEVVALARRMNRESGGSFAAACKQRVQKWKMRQTKRLV